MEQKLNTEQIREYAKVLDDAIEKHDVEEIISCFSEGCVIELLGIRLSGKEGLRKAVAWMHRYLREITLVPITIMVDRNTFFEEFLVKAKVRGGEEVEVKQTEVLVYDDEYKVKNLRLYFDRLELAAAYAFNPIEKIVINQLSRASLKGSQ